MLKKFIRNIVLKEKASSESYVSYLRNKGVSIGDNVRFFSPSNTLVDVTRPWLISIGDNVNITHGVIIITHDYSWSVINRSDEYKGAVYGCEAAVNIGNNVFIGMNAVITCGVTVGDNVIIGAGSVVTKDCESDSVYAGSPAKKIMTLKEFAEKRKQSQFENAKKIAIKYKDHFGTFPPIEIFTEYFMLFCNASEAEKIPQFRHQMNLGNHIEDSVLYMNNNEPMFSSYESFLQACFGSSYDNSV